MSPSRRVFLLSAMAAGPLRWVGARSMDEITSGRGQGADHPAMESHRFTDAWNQETLGATPTHSADISLEGPTIAEDGAFVPLTLRSRIPRTDRIVLFVEKNPFPLIAAFDFSAEVIPAVSLNIKMDQSSPVIVLARAAGSLYRTERWVRVVRGGCGDISG